MEGFGFQPMQSGDTFEPQPHTHSSSPISTPDSRQASTPPASGTVFPVEEPFPGCCGSQALSLAYVSQVALTTLYQEWQSSTVLPGESNPRQCPLRSHLRPQNRAQWLRFPELVQESTHGVWDGLEEPCQSFAGGETRGDPQSHPPAWTQWAQWLPAAFPSCPF